jgi:glycosyltransferase involved in cell wall biosynthesis
LVGSIAEYHPNKNLATLIEATALLTTAQAADVQLVLVSDGEERQALEELSRTRGVAERVHLVGYVDRAAEYLRAFDVFVLPSKKEGLPYVLLEAGLAGLPVIASDIPGNRDIIAQGVTGTLVAGDAAAYVAALQEYLAHPDTARAHASALAERTGSTFSIETMRSNTLAHYISSNPATSRSRSPLRTDRS